MDVYIKDVKKMKSSMFIKEKDMMDFFEKHIDVFCSDVLCDSYVSHSTEIQQNKHSTFSPRMPRVDIYIKCKRKSYLVELKNPKMPSSNRIALGQILAYGAMMDGDDELVIITTMFDILTAKAIKKYNLPITYLFFDGKNCLEFKHEL